MGCTAKLRWEAVVPGGTACAVFGTMGSTPPQAAGSAVVVTVRPATALTWPMAVGAVPGGIRAMGDDPVFRVAKYRPQVSESVARTVLWPSFPPCWKMQTMAL